MKIRLLKVAQIGQGPQFKGWTGEVADEQGESIINAGRGVEVGDDGEPKASKPKAKAVAKKKAPKSSGKTLAEELADES